MVATEGAWTLSVGAGVFNMVATEGAWTLSVGAEREGGPVLVVWRGWGGCLASDLCMAGCVSIMSVVTPNSTSCGLPSLLKRWPVVVFHHC